MKIKICGMKHPTNLKEIVALEPDYLGFIFYPKSPRVVDVKLASQAATIKDIKKIGVFVNAQTITIQNAITEFELDGIQLHGDEQPSQCKKIAQLFPQLLRWKAFGINDKFSLEQIKPYMEYCTHFLFDTKSKKYGGTGTPFAWNLLDAYNFPQPFILSGGIGPENIAQALNWAQQNPHIYALDINSRVENFPGEKQPHLVQKIITTVRNSKTYSQEEKKHVYG